MPFERLRDPEAIAFWPHGIGRDGARTPMPWTREGALAGFSNAGDAWLPLDERHRALAVDAQERDPESVLAFTRAMIELRRGSRALREGAFVALDAPEPVLAFTREAAGERVLCLFNLGPAATRFTLPKPAKATRLALGASLAGQEAQLDGLSTLFIEI